MRIVVDLERGVINDESKGRTGEMNMEITHKIMFFEANFVV